MSDEDETDPWDEAYEQDDYTPLDFSGPSDHLHFGDSSPEIDVQIGEALDDLEAQELEDEARAEDDAEQLEIATAFIDKLLSTEH